MTKFFFVVWALLLGALFYVPAQAQTPAAAPEIRGIWVHTYSPQPWDTVMKKIADAGFNCVFVRVSRGVNALYPSKILPMDGWAADAWKNGQGTDELKAMIDAAHRNGLEFHAWKVCFNAGAGMRAGAGPAAFYQKMSDEDRLARDPNGVQTAFLNPGDPRNRQMEFDVMMEILQNYDVDGLHFDYIRYTETGPGGVENFDYDYGQVSRREFEKVLGRRVQNWPSDVFSGALKIPYEEWERGNINDLVKRVHDATKARRPLVQISAAVWRANRKYRAGIKQDWTLWARENWLDFVVPMDYTADMGRFASDLEEQIPNVAGQIPLAAGIGTYLQKSPEDVVKQIEIARAKGADGYALFSYNDDNIDAILELLKQKINATPVVPSYRAPRANWEINWGVGNGITRKDKPVAFAVDSNTNMSWAVRYSPAQWKSGVLGIYLEHAGESLEYGKWGFAKDSEGATRVGIGFSLKLGISQVVLRGEATDISGKIWPVVIRGPLIEGLSADAFQALKARDLPPRFEAGMRRVAIYAGGQASAGLLKALQSAPGVDAEYIYHLRPEMWRNADVLLLPHLEDVAELAPEVIANLRAYVENGGRLILTHDAVGFRWHPRLFPEVGVGVALSTGRDLIVGENNFGLTAGALTQGYSDHVIIKPAPGATVLAREKDSDKAVVVSGKFGRGTVVMDGALLGFPSAGAMPASEQQLLRDLVTGP